MDCAAILATYANLHGIGLWQMNLIGRHNVVDSSGAVIGVDANFEFNLIKVVGNDNWVPAPQDEFAIRTFDYHRVTCRQLDILRWANMQITDGCLRLDMGQFPHGDDNNLKVPMVPVDLVFTGEEEAIVNINEIHPYNNPYYRERLVRNDNVCIPNQIIMIWGLSGEVNIQQAQRDLIIQSAKRYRIPLNLSDAGFRMHKGSFVPEASGLQQLRKEQQAERYLSYTCSYLGSEIGIDCIECETLAERNFMLVAFLSGVTVTPDFVNAPPHLLFSACYIKQRLYGSLFVC